MTIRKRFRDSGSALLSEQKCPPHHLSNPQGYRDTTIADGGPRRKTEKFCQIETKIGDLFELDNFKQKIFFEKKISKLR